MEIIEIEKGSARSISYTKECQRIGILRTDLGFCKAESWRLV
ncbi:MAG: hypothetical protein OSJ73_02375 [Lachnospiraceae bacterium]|nr:hypothetical protein [Lachnospiraceae bacterium]